MQSINLFNLMRSTGIIIGSITGFNHLFRQIIGVKVEENYFFNAFLRLGSQLFSWLNG